MKYYSLCSFIALLFFLTSTSSSFVVVAFVPSLQQQKPTLQNKNKINNRDNTVTFTSIVIQKNLHPNQASELEAVANDLIKTGALMAGSSDNNEEHHNNNYDHHTDNMNKYEIIDECEIPSSGIIPSWCKRMIPPFQQSQQKQGEKKP